MKILAVSVSSGLIDAQSLDENVLIRIRAKPDGAQRAAPAHELMSSRRNHKST